MSKPVVEVHLRAIAAADGGFAVFLGNQEKAFVILVDQSVGGGDRDVHARHAERTASHP